MTTHHRADLLLLITTLVAAAGWIFSREAVQGLSPLLFMALRFTSAGLILAVIGWAALRNFSAYQWRSATVVGVIFGIAMTFWILGLKHASHIGVGAFLTSLGIVMVPLISLLFGERPNRYVFISLPFVAAGLACLSLDSELRFGLAEIYFLLSALFIAFVFILNSRAAAKISPLPLTAVQLLLTGVITAGGSAVLESWDFQQPPAIWGWLTASALIATSLRFLLQTSGQSLTPASHSAIIMTLEPVWATLFAALWFGESMTLLQFSGCVLIFLAVLVNRLPAVQSWFRDNRHARLANTSRAISKESS